jgi:hypothetical protein
MEWLLTYRFGHESLFRLMIVHVGSSCVRELVWVEVKSRYLQPQLCVGLILTHRLSLPYRYLWNYQKRKKIVCLGSCR